MANVHCFSFKIVRQENNTFLLLRCFSKEVSSVLYSISWDGPGTIHGLIKRFQVFFSRLRVNSLASIIGGEKL